MTQNHFKNKVVLVTGAGKGLGRAICLAFAAEGALVVANDITPVNLDVTVDLARSQGGQVQDFVFDIAKKMPAQAFVQQVLEDYQRVDILINNASVAPKGRLMELGDWEWQRGLDVNLSGPFYLMQAVARSMRQMEGGIIINLGASSHYLQSSPESISLFASKLGLIGLTKAAAQDLAPDHIRVNAVCPGWVQTQQVVSKILELCSPVSAHISGQIFEIDG